MLCFSGILFFPRRAVTSDKGVLRNTLLGGLELTTGFPVNKYQGKKMM
jgi:hypothetical protein